ncbi:MAG: hypothetical protein M3Y91_03155 [Actinomycetota bacterium]|nr:hypothetical protein [Actinomycetota bacterium]
MASLVGTLVSQDMGFINAAVAGNPRPAPGVSDAATLARLIGGLSQDPTSAQTLQEGEVSWLNGRLSADAAAWATTGLPAQFLRDTTDGSATLSFFARAAALVARDGANASSQKLIYGLNSARSPVVGSIPVHVVTSTINESSPAPQPTRRPPNSASRTVADTVEYLVARAILTHGLNTSQYLPDPTQGPQPYLDANGQLIEGKLSADAQNSLNLWLAGDKNPDQQNMLLPHGPNETLRAAIETGLSRPVA